MARATVAISDDFLSAFVKLPRKEQAKTSEFISKFRSNPESPGIHYEKIRSGLDDKICSVRIDLEYRGIVVRQASSNTYILLWVDHHDEAYRWAARKKCMVNPVTGGIQVFDVDTTPVSVLADGAATPAKKLFDRIGDKDLMRLGVPEELLPLVRSLNDRDDFLKAAGRLPKDTYENLNWLVEGIPLKEVFDMISAEALKEKPTDNLSDALERPESMKSFTVVKGEEELRRILAEPLEKWRVFLHPTQRKLVQALYHGPARVLGGAGTGKTVVAMHRAHYLASKAGEGERILFTTFTANLAEDILSNLKKICTPDELRHITVINLDAWATRFLKEQGYKPKVIFDKEAREKLDEAMAECDDVEYDLGFYEEEWKKVVMAQETFSFQKYAVASRLGRGTRLNRLKRRKIWNVFDAYIRDMKSENFRDVEMALYDCRLLIEQKGAGPMYQHIIVDEGQDLSPAAYRLIRVLAGEKHDNDIFIVGDAHQRIYKNHASLGQCGIDIRGRGSILRLNYRTTEEIRKYAFALLKGINFDDLDDSTDVGDTCRSLMHGEKPVIKKCRTANQELDFITSTIEDLQKSGVKLRNICLVARTNSLVDNYKDALQEKGIPIIKITKDSSDSDEKDGIRIATMHRVKGLEFEYVFVAGANNNVIPLKNAIDETDEVSREESLISEKCLLYVALTRARRGAFISSFGKASPFLGKSTK